MKSLLLNNLQNVDSANSGSIGIDKFLIECNLLAIKLSNEDIDDILLLFEDKKRYNNYRNISSIFY